MKFLNKHLECEFCDGTTETKTVSRTFKRFGQEFRFENIEAEVCPKCGEIYFDGKILKEIEEKIRRESLPLVA
jgi:YgiT-type zinc finger domain-containing protein